MFTRYAYEDVDLADGATVKAGDQIGLLLGAATAIPTRLLHPTNSGPAARIRKNAVSFSAGRHPFLHRRPLARLELQVSLKTLFDRLPGLVAGGRAGLPGHLPFPWAGEAGGPVRSASAQAAEARL